MRRFLATILAGAAAALLAGAQTTINGGRVISGIWDAGGAAVTKPAKTGAVLPPTCEVGEQFFKTDAPAGQNLHLCTAPDNWTAVSGGGEAGSEPPYFKVSRASATVLTVTAGGVVRFGSKTCASPSMPANLTITTGSNVSGTARLFVSADCSLTWALNFTDDSKVACNVNCATAPGVAQFPAGAVPLFQWDAAADAWAASGADLRAFLSAKTSKAAPAGGIVVAADADGADVFSVDPAAVVMPGDVSSSPAAGKIPQADGAGKIAAGWMPLMTGDSGSGGSAGLAPAPEAGAAADGKFLKADGTWQVPEAGGDEVTVNGVPVSPNFSDSSPAAPSTGAFPDRGIALKWQRDATNVSAYVPAANLTTRPSFRRWAVWMPNGNGASNALIGDGNVGSIGTTTTVPADANNGVLLRYASAATAGSMAGTSGNLNWRTGRNLYLDWVGRLGQTADIRAWIGLATASWQDTDSPAGEGAAFRYSNCTGCAGDATWMCYARNGSGETTAASSGVAVSTTAAQQLEIVFDDAASPRTVTYKINGAQVCQFDSTSHNIPSLGQNLKLTWYVVAKADAARDIAFSSIYYGADK